MVEAIVIVAALLAGVVGGVLGTFVAILTPLALIRWQEDLTEDADSRGESL